MPKSKPTEKASKLQKPKVAASPATAAAAATAAPARGAAAAAAAVYAPAVDDEDEEDDWTDEESPHLVESISWGPGSLDVEGLRVWSTDGKSTLVAVPDAVLDRRAFHRGTFTKRFDFIVCATGMIRARGLDPNITIRQLFTKLDRAVAAQKAKDGHWEEDGSMKCDEHGKPLHDYTAYAQRLGFIPGYEINFYDKYWLARPYVEGLHVDGSKGLVYVDSWGS